MLFNAHFEIWNKNIAGLARDFSVNPDSCENKDFYETYLRYSALTEQNTGRVTTHVLIDDDKNAIMGFVTLRASSVITRSPEGTSLLGAPALEVFMLSVSKEYEGKRVGSMLIDFAISEAAHLHNEHIGVSYIVLAADKNAVGFYKKCGFTEIETDEKYVPRENSNQNCSPMYYPLDFENYVSYSEDI